MATTKTVWFPFATRVDQRAVGVLVHEGHLWLALESGCLMLIPAAEVGSPPPPMVIVVGPGMAPPLAEEHPGPGEMPPLSSAAPIQADGHPEHPGSEHPDSEFGSGADLPDRWKGNAS